MILQFIQNITYKNNIDGLECVEYLSGTVGSGYFTAENPILFITLDKRISGSFPWNYYYEGSPILNMQTYSVIRYRDDGYQDHFNHTISSFSLGTVSEDGKTIIFSADYYGYNYKIYY